MEPRNSKEMLEVMFVIDDAGLAFRKEVEIYAQRKNILKQNAKMFLQIAIAIVALLLSISGLLVNIFLFYSNGIVLFVLINYFLKENFFSSKDLDIEYQD